MHRGQIIIREPNKDDKEAFLRAMNSSQLLHRPWVNAPLTENDFDEYLRRSQLPNQKSFLVCAQVNKIAGVFNVSEIVRGLFQNAYLGFYAVAEYAGQGYMSAGLKLVLAYVFTEMQLHRLEANIQPANSRSIQLVQSNGFRYEGYSPHYLKINNQWCGHERWAITKEDLV
jgi:RimJ/RimL family protein N-acetyltransferase